LFLIFIRSGRSQEPTAFIAERDEYIKSLPLPSIKFHRRRIDGKEELPYGCAEVDIVELLQRTVLNTLELSDFVDDVDDMGTVVINVNMSMDGARLDNFTYSSGVPLFVKFLGNV
jgi:hypothetical protein